MEGYQRIHSRFIPGRPGFSALAVEIQDLGTFTWQVVDVFSLSIWISRPEAREDMRSLLQELESAGYQPWGNCSFREAA